MLPAHENMCKGRGEYYTNQWGILYQSAFWYIYSYEITGKKRNFASVANYTAVVTARSN